MPAAMSDDDQMMARVARGDHEAFRELVAKYQAQLLNFFLRMGALRDEAEDLTQETFLRLYNYCGKYKPEGRFVGFLYVLARHARADMHRKSKRSTEIGSESIEHAVDGRAPHHQETDARLDVNAAVAGLSEKLRMVVVLAVYQGLDYSQVSEALGIPLGTVKSRMHLAMRDLREAFDVRLEK